MLSALAAGLLLGFDPSAPAFMFSPDVYGSKVVYTCEGDLWLGDLKTGTAERLTRNEGLENYARFSPDGKMIAYTATYDGTPEVFVIPTAGGEPRRLTYRWTYAEVMGWTEDGKNVLFRTNSVPRSYSMNTVPVTGGEPTRLPMEFTSHCEFGPGTSFAWTRYNRWDDAWFRYKGGLQNQIWTGDSATKTFKKITNLPGTNEFPVWADGRIYFVNEDDAEFTVMSVAPQGGKPTVVAGPYPFEVRRLASDGRSLIYEKGRDIELYDIATGLTTTLTFRMSSDFLHTRPFTVASDGFVESASPTTTGKRVLVESRGQILSFPVGEGEARVWKAQDGVRLRRPLMSPKGDLVAYISDESGEEQLMVAKADGSGARAITSDTKRRLTNFSWSPDGQWIALNDSNMALRLVNVAAGTSTPVGKTNENWSGVQHSFSPDSKWLAMVEAAEYTSFGAVSIHEIATGKRTKVSSGMANDSAVAFSRDGNYLAVISYRNMAVSNDATLNQLNTQNATVPILYPLRADQPSPFLPKDTDEGAPPAAEAKGEGVKIDFAGLYDRGVELPVPPGSYSQIEVVGDRVILAGGGQIWSFDIGPRLLRSITPGGGFILSGDNKKLMVLGGQNVRVVDVGGNDIPPTAGVPSDGGLRLRINPVAEWKQMFWDAWRLIRDYFYVVNMHGLNWDEIGRKYSALLSSVRSRWELDELIRWMQAELGVSHSYLSPGDERSLKPGTPGAFLGIDVVADASGFYKISKILRGDGFRNSERSPLLEPGMNVKEGDLLIEVAGVPARVGTDYRAAIAGRAGRIVTVLVNDRPTKEGARVLRVRPVANELRMRRLTWVAENRERVSKASNGRIGYIYMAAMGNEDMMDFIRTFYPQRNKEALLIDTRFNNGGYVQSMINRILAEDIAGLFNMRASSSWSRQSDYFLGPMACLQNEFNISCGEEFTHRFRILKLGKIIGKRSYGGEVGSSPGWSLVDGGVVSVPNYGMYEPGKGWVIETEGVKPDIEVDSDPNLYAQGRDPQIEKGVEHLLEELRKNPVVWPKQPADPVKVGKKGGG